MTNQGFQRGLEAYDRDDFEAALREWRLLPNGNLGRQGRRYRGQNWSSMHPRYIGS